MKPHCILLIGVGCFIAVVLAVPGQTQEIVSAESYPVVGQPVRIEFRSSGPETQGPIRLFAEYRPNSETGFIAEVSDKSGPGVWSFTPLAAGIVQLKVVRSASTEAGSEKVTLAQKSISVKYNGVPVSGISIMLLAGLVLLGGNVLSVRQALKS